MSISVSDELQLFAEELHQHHADDIGIIGCGSKFPDESLLGVDLIIPDITYLQGNKDKVRALVVTLSKAEGKMISDPDIISRGFVYVRDAEDFLKGINQLVTTTINNIQKTNIINWNVLKKHIRETLGQFLYEQTKRKPMILPIIIEV